MKAYGDDSEQTDINMEEQADAWEHVAQTWNQWGEDHDYYMEQVAQTWKQWGEDEDVTTGSLDECDKDFNERGLGPKKPHDDKRKWPKGTRGVKTRAGLQCMLRSYETHIV